jgi:hypothetical protein
MRRESTAWVANECIYYSIARLSRLRMPEGALLEVEGRLCWGSEFLPGRNKLPKTGAAQLLLKACQSSRDELLNLARALLLDLALLNSDRKPWNILASHNEGESPILWYFDHDKSLLGDAREQEESPPGDLGRIHMESIADAKVADYFACAEANDLVLGGLTDGEIRNIFGDLALNPESLEVARRECPSEWLSGRLFERLAAFLTLWWNHMRERFRSISPRNYLSSALRDRSLTSVQLN